MGKKFCLHPDNELVGGCPFCAKYHGEPAFKAAVDIADGGKGNARPPNWRERMALPCVYRGDPTGERRQCQECTGSVQVPLLACDIHGVCSERKLLPGVACCTICKERQPEPPAPGPRPDFSAVTVRNLIYHLYPLAGAWERCVDALLPRLDLFNGKLVIAVARDPDGGRPPDLSPELGGPAQGGRRYATCDSLAAVRDRFGASAGRVEFLEFVNDPGLREVATLLPLLERVKTDDPAHATLYGQSKGVTYEPGHPCRRWGEVMAEVCLDYWPLVEESLRTRPLAGVFRKDGAGWPVQQSRSTWHYSGSWFWFRNAELFKRNWRRVDRFWSGVESYPGLHFHVSEAACLLHSAPVPAMNLYDHRHWERTVEPALRHFRTKNATARTPRDAPRRLNLGCGPYPRDGWLNADVAATETVRPDVLVPDDGPLPWPDGHFDRAYLGHVLEHVPWERVPALLAEVRRVVRPGGEVCCVGPDLEMAVARVTVSGEPAGAVRHVLECAETDQQHPSLPGGPGARHHWNCTESRLLAAMQAAGFADVRALPMTPDAMDGWPVVCFVGAQCAVVGRVP